MTADNPENVCFVDTETLGLDPDRHPIWEVALIVPDPAAAGCWRDYIWQLPVDLGKADPIALGICQFHDRRKPASYLTGLDEFAAKFELLTRGKHLVGAVVSFDEERLRRLLRANGACQGWHYHLCDVENLIAGLFGLAPPWDSEDLSRRVGVLPEQFDRHTAMGDAKWAKAMYEAVMAWPREARA